MVYYKFVKVIIDIPSLAKVIINMIVHYHSIFQSIFANQGLLFISKFLFSLCYFLDITRKLSIVFRTYTNGQTKRQNSIIEV